MTLGATTGTVGVGVGAAVGIGTTLGTGSIVVSVGTAVASTGGAVSTTGARLLAGGGGEGAGLGLDELFMSHTPPAETPSTRSAPTAIPHFARGFSRGGRMTVAWFARMGATGAGGATGAAAAAGTGAG